MGLNSKKIALMVPEIRDIATALIDHITDIYDNAICKSRFKVMQQFTEL